MIILYSKKPNQETIPAHSLRLFLGLPTTLFSFSFSFLFLSAPFCFPFPTQPPSRVVNGNESVAATDGSQAAEAEFNMHDARLLESEFQGPAGRRPGDAAAGVVEDARRWLGHGHDGHGLCALHPEAEAGGFCCHWRWFEPASRASRARP